MLLERSTLLSVVLACVASLGASAQDIDPAAREALMSPALKGTSVSRVTKEVWTAKDGQGRLLSYTLGDYELRLANLSDGSTVLGVLQAGKVLFASQSMDGSSVELLIDPARGMDVDKDGSADAVVGSFSGGMHCCYSYQVLSFAPKFRAGATLDGGESPLEVVGDGPNVVFKGTDGVLGYWHSDFASSVFSDVYLQVSGDSVSLAEAWMKYPPSEDELAKMKAESAAAFASKENWMQSPENGEPPYAPRVLMQHVVKLIYTGNGAQALALLKDTWKGEAAKPKAIATDLLTQLSKSAYWEDLKKMNTWTGEPAAIVQASLAAK